jgi:hypothetical protein
MLQLIFITCKRVIAALQVIWRDGIVAAQAIVIILVAPVLCQTEL